MKRKIAITALIALLGCLSAAAQTDSTVTKIIEANHQTIAAKKQTYNSSNHEIRIGVGDGFYDKVAFPDTPHRPYSSAPGDATFLEEHNHRYIPHIFAEYTLMPSKSRFGFGGGVDFFGFNWDDVTYRSGSDDPVSTEHQNCFNIAVTGHLRYRWDKPGDRLMVYSALHFGLNVNTGSEINMYGRRTEVGFAFEPTVIGIRYSFGHLVVAADFGAHFALKDALNVYSALSKIGTLSVGYIF